MSIRLRRYGRHDDFRSDFDSAVEVAREVVQGEFADAPDIRVYIRREVRLLDRHSGWSIEVEAEFGDYPESPPTTTDPAAPAK